MKVLTREQILRLHTELVVEIGGSDGIRDVGFCPGTLGTKPDTVCASLQV